MTGLEIVLFILLLANILLFMIYVSGVGHIAKIIEDLDVKFTKITTIINLNASSQNEAMSTVAENTLDIEFIKRVLEVHSEALQVRSSMGILNEKSWPTYKVKE